MRHAFARTASRWRALAADAIAAGYIGGITALATLIGPFYLLFPELGALSHDVLTRPYGAWARQRFLLVATPACTAVVGTLVTRTFSYNVISIEVIVCLCIAIIAVLNSSIAPALSAGLLPLVLGVRSWLYPVSITAGLVALVVTLILWRWLTSERPAGPRDARASNIDDILEQRPRGLAWVPTLLVFVGVAGLGAQLTGLRFILFPPLVVMAYEMFGHPNSCPWALRPVALPIACSITALAGLSFYHAFGVEPTAAVATMVVGILVNKVTRVHMPPALAVGLLPLVMHNPAWSYVVSVAIGTSALTVCFVFQRQMFDRWQARRSRRHELATMDPAELVARDEEATR